MLLVQLQWLLFPLEKIKCVLLVCSYLRSRRLKFSSYVGPSCCLTKIFFAVCWSVAFFSLSVCLSVCLPVCFLSHHFWPQFSNNREIFCHNNLFHQVSLHERYFICNLRHRRWKKVLLLRIWKPCAHKQTAVPKLSYFAKYVFIVRIHPLCLWELHVCATSYFLVRFITSFTTPTSTNYDNANNNTARGIVRAVRALTKRFVLAWRQMRECVILRPMGDERIRDGVVLCKKAEPRHAVRPMKAGHA